MIAAMRQAMQINISATAYKISIIPHKSLETNISSIGASTTLEISIASLSEDCIVPFSSRIIVSRRTPTCAANCSCVKSFNSLYIF